MITEIRFKPLVGGNGGREMELDGGLSFYETLMETGGAGVSIPAGVGRGRARGVADGGGGRGREARGTRNRGTEWRELAGVALAAGLCSARTGGRRERKEEEEKVPGEEGIRSCARVKAEHGMEGEDRRAAMRGGVA